MALIPHKVQYKASFPPGVEMGGGFFEGAGFCYGAMLCQITSVDTHTSLLVQQDAYSGGFPDDLHASRTKRGGESEKYQHNSNWYSMCI